MALHITKYVYEINPKVGFHKPIYALRQPLTLCTKLLCLKKLLKSWAQSVKWLCAQLLAIIKSTPGLVVLLRMILVGVTSMWSHLFSNLSSENFLIQFLPWKCIQFLWKCQKLKIPWNVLTLLNNLFMNCQVNQLTLLPLFWNINVLFVLIL